MKSLVASIIVGLVLVTGFVALPTHVLAQGQSVDNVCNSVTTAQKPDVCKAQDVEVVGTDGVIVRAARLVGVLTAIASVVAIMVGGFKYIISAGDSANVNSAKNTILYAIVGLLISLTAPVLLAYALQFF